MTLAVLAIFVFARCTPSPPTPLDTEDPRDTEVVEQVHHEEASLTLSVRRVEQPGWSGRAVVATVTAGPRRHVRVVPAPRPAPLAEIIASDSPPQPFAAINGGFYETDGTPMGLVRAGGHDAHAADPRGGSGILVVERGLPRIVYADDYEPSASITDGLQSIDRLVDSGASLVSPRASRRRAARSAVALDRHGALHLVVAFDDRAVGRETESRIELAEDATRTGPTIAQMAELLMRAPADGGVGAVQALGLDGGFSTSLLVKSASGSLSVVAFHATINGLLVSVNDE